MITVSEEILDEMVQVIVREIDPDQVYLFGSRARGDARADSDIDLLIIDHKPFGPGHSRFQECNRVYRALSSFHVPKDIRLYSSEEFIKWRHSLNHVIGRCYREGKLLYARPWICLSADALPQATLLSEPYAQGSCSVNDTEHARMLLRMAEQDLAALKAMGDVVVFADEIFGFHAQQAIEKSLKAWLAFLHLEYPLTYDLSALLALLEQHGCDVEMFQELVFYTPFAVVFRYGHSNISVPALVRPTVCGQVQSFYDHVKVIIERSEAVE
jgi:HEPN domain-containing protein/predicted nucleotidyltransferase